MPLEGAVFGKQKLYTSDVSLKYIFYKIEPKRLSGCVPIDNVRRSLCSRVPLVMKMFCGIFCCARVLIE